MNLSTSETQNETTTVFDRLGHWLVRLSFVASISIFITAPILAISWRNLPFPGFFVEQTLVVNQNKGENWGGWLAGMTPGERVVRMAGFQVTTPDEYSAALASLVPGDEIAVFTTLPDGSGRLYPSLNLGKISNDDFFRFFWLPYLIGLIYLGIGVWIYRARGQTRPGLALTIFCVLVSVICGLIFDISTTHLSAAVWAVTLSLSGAALISLAMCFPQNWLILRKHLWVLAAPYALSIPLSLWNVIVAFDTAHPWAYLSALQVTYIYLTLGILSFIGIMLFHARKSTSSVVRRQARIVLLGSSFAFIPIMIWFLAPLLSIPLEFNASLFLTPLIMFPFSISIAILRYRLWEIDALVNRALVYSLLTAVLAGIFTAMIAFSQKMFVWLTGNKNDAAIVITTLIVGSAIAPIRTRLQLFVDRQFKEVNDDTKEIKAFGEQVNAYVQMNDFRQLTLRLLHETAESLHAECGAFSVVNDNQSYPQILHTYRLWRGEIMMNVPVEHENDRFGFLMLGPRQNGLPYTQQEYNIIKGVCNQIAGAIKLNQRISTNYPPSRPAH